MKLKDVDNTSFTEPPTLVAYMQDLRCLHNINIMRTNSKGISMNVHNRLTYEINLYGEIPAHAHIHITCMCMCVQCTN